MADVVNDVVILIAVIGLTLLVVYLYLSAISKAFRSIGFTAKEASTIVLLTLVLGTVWIPLFPYNDWIVAISIGGALIPIAICVQLLRTKRVGGAEVATGTVIVAYVTYFITRAEEGVGIVADVPIAFAPAIAAGLFSLSTFWADLRKAAPVAYFSGVIGTLIGADVFHLDEILAFGAPEENAVLVIGGASIFDMVYLTGIVAVLLDLLVFWVKNQQAKRGFGIVISEFERGAEGLPYAKTVRPSPKLYEERRRGRT